jgi:hypothetical protein
VLGSQQQQQGTEAENITEDEAESSSSSPNPTSPVPDEAKSEHLSSTSPGLEEKSARLELPKLTVAV